MSAEETVVIEHLRCGRLEIPVRDVLHFDPLPGFPHATRFALIAHDRATAFAWLVSLDEPGLAFVVTDPWQFFPDYAPPLGDLRLQSVGAHKPEEVVVVTLVTLREERPTLNLMAPLLLCATARRGRQIILDDGAYSTSQPLPDLEPSSASDAPRAGDAQTESKPQT